MHPIRIAGEALIPDVSGALYWPAERTLIAADLHLEKGSAFAKRGAYLPPYDSRATLIALARLCRHYAPARVILLGDSFHDPEGPKRLPTPERALLARLAARHEFIWITGNHEKRALDTGHGVWTDRYPLGSLLFRHEPGGDEDGEVAGHLHPCARVTVRGRSLRLRCFASDGRRAVLPAFGAYTGGLDLFDDAFAGLFATPLRAWLCGRRSVHALAAERLSRLS